jgi:hypothetical protein
MKHIIRGILVLAVFAASTLYSGQPAPGVVGVDVVVKQNPGKRAMTDTHGSFVLDGLAPGSYTVTFRARPAKDVKSPPKTMVSVASSYTIKLEVGNQSVNQGGFSADRLRAGIDFPVQVGSGATIRGQVLGVGNKRMVWIPQEVGSNIPGHWVDADSPEGKAATKRATFLTSKDTLNRMQDEHTPFHQEGWKGESNGLKPDTGHPR